MVEERVQRRLAAILAADVVGYSRLMQRDETETLARLQSSRAAPYKFDGVRYQDILPNGTLITADKNNHQAKIIGPDNKLLRVLGTGNPERGPGKFATPEGIEVKGDTLWVSDSGNDRVVMYRIRRK